MKTTTIVLSAIGFVLLFANLGAQPKALATWGYVGTCKGVGQGTTVEGPCEISVSSKYPGTKAQCDEEFYIRTDFGVPQKPPRSSFNGMPLKIQGNKFTVATCPTLAEINEWEASGTITAEEIEGQITVLHKAARTKAITATPNTFTFKAKAGRTRYATPPNK